MRSRSQASISPRTVNSPKSKAATSPVDAPREVRQREAEVRKTGSRRSRWIVLARIVTSSVSVCSPQWRGPARPGRRADLAPLCGRRRAIPDSLTAARGDAVRGRALVVERSRALASSATAAHFPNRSFRAIWRRTSPAPAAAGRKASSGCGWSTPPASMPRRSCRPITARMASNALAGLARQADPYRRTDRGHRGVSRKLA